VKFNCAYTKLVDTHKLVPHPKNPNKHSDEQVARLAKIIDFQGQRSPVVVSSRSGFITKGHGRLLAMMKLGWEHVAVDCQDYDDEAQEYADIVADNAIAAWAVLDLKSITDEVKGIPDFDLDLLGMNSLSITPIAPLDEEPEKEEPAKKYILEIQFPNDCEMMDIHDELVPRGYIVRVK